MARSQIKGEFRHKGNDNQKSADFIFNVQRVRVDEIKKWTLEQKESAGKWIDECRELFEAYFKAIKQGCEI